MKQTQHDFSFKMDLRWCIEELQTDNIITQRDANLVFTSHRKKEQLDWHPLRYLASFNLQNTQNKNQPLTAKDLTLWMAEKKDMEVIHVDPLKVDVPACTNFMSFEFAKRHSILAIDVTKQKVVIGTDQPFYTDWIEHIEHALQHRELKIVILNPEQINRFRPEFYNVTKAIAGANTGYTEADTKGVEALLQLGDIVNPDANDQHIVRIVDWLFQYAFDQGASDIHLEPRKDSCNVRFRIDGVLHTVYKMPPAIMLACISRIKILGRLNVAEKRKPQDGRLKTVTPRGMETELRLSTLPTAFGEKMVMRVFDPEVLVRNFTQLGLTGADLDKWKTMVAHPNGIILVTGPTGSGKTTTLYSTLKKLATEQVNVCTIEDPIEMIEPSFNQMQIQESIQLHFSDGIRSLMRQDPDIIMIGEIRDAETANMAVQASLTGHLVLSTLHTNDAPSSLTRLHDLGVQPFLTGSTILGVMAQRLVRTLCSECKVVTQIDTDAWNDLVAPWKTNVPQTVYKGGGCDKCRGTGFKGRIGIYEILVLSNEMKKIISQNGALHDIKRQAYKEGLQPLRLAGAKKIAEGMTTIEEVMRVVPLN